MVDGLRGWTRAAGKQSEDRPRGFGQIVVGATRGTACEQHTDSHRCTRTTPKRLREGFDHRCGFGLRTPKVALIIPAHNEEEDLPDALSSVKAQTRLPDRTIVVADNCSDDTEGVAASIGG